MTKTPIIIIAVVLLCSAVTFGALYTIFIQPFLTNNPIDDQTPINTPIPTQTASSTTNPTLTPARDLVGTWKTSYATKFNIQVDGTEVGYENRTMTWVITPTSEESKVNVQITFIGMGRELIADSGYTPDVSPMFLTGTISGTRLTLESNGNYYEDTIGEFAFTSDIIEGTWHDHWELLYNQNVYTVTNGLTLAKE